MGTRVKRRAKTTVIRRRLAPVLLVFIVVVSSTTVGAGCGSSSDGNEEVPVEDPVEAEPEDVIELEPAPFELPDDCDELRQFAADASEAYDKAAVGTQELIDAKARFDGAINEQMLLGCV